MNRAVLKNIYLAQMASDGGKGIYELPPWDETKKEKRLGYDQKDEYILRAINLILKKKETGFSFYVTICEELNSYLVYFETVIDEGLYQVSFHSYCDELAKYIKKNAKHYTVWDEESSRETCELLKEVMRMDEEIRHAYVIPRS